MVITCLDNAAKGGGGLVKCLGYVIIVYETLTDYVVANSV